MRTKCWFPSVCAKAFSASCADSNSAIFPPHKSEWNMVLPRTLEGGGRHKSVSRSWNTSRKMPQFNFVSGVFNFLLGFVKADGTSRLKMKYSDPSYRRHVGGVAFYGTPKMTFPFSKLNEQLRRWIPNYANKESLFCGKLGNFNLLFMKLYYILCCNKLRQYRSDIDFTTSDGNFWEATKKISRVNNWSSTRSLNKLIGD